MHTMLVLTNVNIYIRYVLRNWWKYCSPREIIQSSNQSSDGNQIVIDDTVYPKKYAHGFVVLCFVVVMQSFIMNSHEVFIHIHQGCFAGTGAIVRLPQCQWSKPDGYGKISQSITTTKHSKAKTVCIFLGIYCRCFPPHWPTYRWCVWLILPNLVWFLLAWKIFSGVHLAWEALHLMWHHFNECHIDILHQSTL